MREISIIGPGNWGTSLEAGLRRAGVPVAEVVGRRAVRGRVVNWSRARLDAPLIWLCVPDGAIAGVAQEVVRRRGNLSGQTVMHSSGALSSVVLEPARQAGARVAAVHPVMTFPAREAVPLEGVLFGIEAADRPTRSTIEKLVKRLGGVPFVVDGKKKALYHAAATMASPLLVAALTAARDAARLAGLDEETAKAWVAALAVPTVGNVAARGAENSFSGPFARGDAETIHLHLQALAAHPILTAVYRSLAREALAALPVRNRPALAEALEEDRQAGAAKPEPRTRGKRLRERLKPAQ
ncbi:Rossmann-like and DUF2520 domain-containing protein [Silvibacterium dinghuense]|uniref:Rossmann-like and DUF2520 domain-containing protein n=1 Tax=Silvibacterium dinghuense TaxID=1560006 RepID=UPI0013E9494F|nr:DUF2520 domain-containing protein [Silvibacterium dinghuense]GGH16529.1 NADP oxidoreductase [Silvibacterium dinghuense]